MITDQNTEKFASIESEINYPSTYAGAALAWFAVLLFLGLAGFPIFELKHSGFINLISRKPGHFFGLMVMELLCLGGCLFIGLYLYNARKKNKYSVVVNSKGAFIYSPDGSIYEQFLYSELCCSTENPYSDISLRINARNTTPGLFVCKIGKHESCVKHLMSFQFEYYTIKNRFELYRHFLKGVGLFRPDLKIQYITLLHFRLANE